MTVLRLSSVSKTMPTMLLCQVEAPFRPTILVVLRSVSSPATLEESVRV